MRFAVRILALPLSFLLLLPLLAREQKKRGVDPAIQRGAVLWRDPAPVESLDLAGGPGGADKAPQPPFTFVKKVSSGVTHKVKVRDAAGREWVVKWGHEVKAENVASRLVWAAGYFTIPTYFVKSGVIQGARDLGGASKYVNEEGSFGDARFQIWEERFLKANNWTWRYNPFIGTRELSGLKIMVMLTSNWDIKDARDADIGINTAILDYSQGGQEEYRYLISDWGGSMGKWGTPGIERDKWDCEGYTKQTPDFVKRVKNGVVEWGFSGWHDINDGITVDDVRFVADRLGRLSAAQIRATLEASGASPEEVTCFSAAIANRIEQLKKVAAAAPAP
jgi:hypothetical protein